jgi:Outer membrane protein beta-barrel domain
VSSAAADAQTPSASPAPQSESTGTRIGVQGLGFVGLDFPRAEQSVEALGLDKRPVEAGGGVRVTNLWRALFVDVHASRWSTSGERAFVDSTGEVFPLGIPLDVDATHLDVSVGWRFYPRQRTSIRTAVPYFAGGAGVVRYREESPFAEPGDDLRTSATTYHVAAGLDYPLNRWLAIAADARYRFAPDVVGDDGVSSAFEEDDLGGFRLTVGVRVGFGGAAPVTPRRPEPADDPARRPDLVNPTTPPPVDTGTGTTTADAPVYLLPDRTRVPLRVLEAGTSVRILEETEGWVRIEFRDPQFGTRVGYVESKFVRR